MKKSILLTFACILCMLIVMSTAYAASYDGAIWTSKPGLLGIGYYATSAQNRSGGDVSTHWAEAKTWTEERGEDDPIYVRVTGNNRAVASSGTTKPIDGWGAYGEPGWSTSGDFDEGAWD